MTKTSALFGFHAVTVRLKIAPDSIECIYTDQNRSDARMRQFAARAEEAGVRLIEAQRSRLDSLAGTGRHQGVVAIVHALRLKRTLDELLDDLEEAGTPPLLLLLDGITDPHNLGAILRVADAAGVHAVLAPKDQSVSINATVAKVASGAAESVPYFMVTNLGRTIKTLQARNIWVTGTSDAAQSSLYDTDLTGAVALVIGAEGKGMRRLTQQRCDRLAYIPMQGVVESLNASVATGVCLFEAVRQRLPVSAEPTKPAAGTGSS